MRSPSQLLAASEPPKREADVLRSAFALVSDRLPSGWSLSLVEEDLVADRRVDALAEFAAPGGAKATFLVEVKRAVVTSNLPALLDQLKSVRRHLPGEAEPMVVARYLGSSARAWLEERGVSYADATGNMFVLRDRPALFLRDRGADRDPWRGPGRPRGSLLGPPAARVVRALLDFRPPMTVPALARRSGASTGATYRVVDFLEQEALLARNPRGPVTDVNWRKLLERWSKDYGFQSSNTVGGYLSPRGLPALLDGLRASSGLRYALTGSLAAHRMAPYAPARLAMVYVADPAEAVSQLKLRPVDSGANVLLGAGDYDVVFERTVEEDGLTYAAPSQIAVDLLTGPGRSPAEAQALIEWMETNETAWRR